MTSHNSSTTKRRLAPLTGVLAVLAATGLIIGLGSPGSTAASKTTNKKATKKVTTKAAAKSTVIVTTTAAAATTAIPTSTTAVAPIAAIANVWSGAKVDPTKLPIGDDSVTTAGSGVGKLYTCRAGNSNAGGAHAEGPWIKDAAKTWDSTTKLAVQGEISWPSAKYAETVTAGKRVLVSNNLPVNFKTGSFPIASTDPSYAYDRNPGSITASDTTYTLPEVGTVAAKASCMGLGAVGMLRNGVQLFNAMDGRGQDAVARESQDLCQGHPARTTYHYHNVSSCLLNAATGPSSVVGWIVDGFPLVVERDASGALPTNADLDECHGRTSPILLNDKIVTTYHYSATLEFPYTVGCYKGTAASLR